MDASQISSQEMLDQLLREGKISDEDYLRLSKAIEQAPDVKNEPSYIGFYKKGYAVVDSLPWPIKGLIGIYFALAMDQIINLAAKSPLGSLTVAVIGGTLLYNISRHKNWIIFLMILYCVVSILVRF